MASGVNYEDACFRDTYMHVRSMILKIDRLRSLSQSQLSHGSSIAEARIKGIIKCRKEIPNVAECCDFEHVWFSVDHFPLYSREKPIWRQDERTI